MGSTFLRVGLALVCACTGCGTGASRQLSLQVERTDSAGVEIVLTSHIDALPQWTLAASPLVSIGSVEGGGADSFNHVAGALLLPDSSILISDRSPAAVRLFDHRGKFIRQLVRDGQGPAELRYAEGPTRLRGDSIAVLDQVQNRVVFFDPALNHAATKQIFGYRDGDSSFALPVVPISSVEAIAQLFPSPRRPAPGTTIRTPVTLGLLSLDGTGFIRIAAGRGSESYTSESGLGFALPLAARTVTAVGRSAVYLGDSDRPAVGVWLFDGRQVRTIQWAASPDPTTADDGHRAFAAESAALMASREIRQTRSAFRQHLFTQMRALPVPQHLPYFTGLVPTDGGGLWIARGPRPWLDTTEFLVADSTGALVARIEVPSRLSVLQVGPDRVLGRWRTEDDVSLVQVYEIVRRPQFDVAR